MKRKIIFTAAAAVLLLAVVIFIVGENMLFSKAQVEEPEKAEAKQEDHVEETEQSLETQAYYLPLSHSEKRKTPITHVVIHFSSNVAAKPDDPFQIKDIHAIYDDHGVSAHYVIDRNGEIYQFVSEGRSAYHAGKGALDDFPDYENRLNDYSIGIELLGIGTKEEMATFIDEDVYDELNPEFIGYTSEQYGALTELLDDIHARNPEIERNRKHVIGHDEYAPDRKHDPGALFDWSNIDY